VYREDKVYSIIAIVFNSHQISVDYSVLVSRSRCIRN